MKRDMRKKRKKKQCCKWGKWACRVRKAESRAIRMKVKQKERKGWQRKEDPSSLLSTLPHDLAFSSSPSAVCNCLSSCVCMCGSSHYLKSLIKDVFWGDHWLNLTSFLFFEKLKIKQPYGYLCNFQSFHWQIHKAELGISYSICRVRPA